MSDAILAVLIAEERALLQKLEAVQQAIRAYGGTPVSNEPGVSVNLLAAAIARSNSYSAEERTAARRPTEKTLQIKDIVRQKLSAAGGSPVLTRDLVAAIESAGVEVGGKNSSSTLSALLSHADEFRANGRLGWTLSSQNNSAEEISSQEIESSAQITETDSNKQKTDKSSIPATASHIVRTPTVYRNSDLLSSSGVSSVLQVQEKSAFPWLHKK